MEISSLSPSYYLYMCVCACVWSWVWASMYVYTHHAPHLINSNCLLVYSQKWKYRDGHKDAGHENSTKYYNITNRLISEVDV